MKQDFCIGSPQEETGALAHFYVACTRTEPPPPPWQSPKVAREKIKTYICIAGTLDLCLVFLYLFCHLLWCWDFTRVPVLKYTVVGYIFSYSFFTINRYLVPDITMFFFTFYH